ncbi:MAG: DNA-directed RNA polymerase subunit beta, partial [Symbiobacteriaceae bacterium]|nr:DNA-directed RNA polymerase subunit beta [Symbiobacteriaceae bacterium]
MPNLIEVQQTSYQWFLNTGLKELLRDISPVQDFTNNLSLVFGEHRLGKPKYSVEEAKERDVTYAAPLRIEVQLINRQSGEVTVQDVFMGDFPLMTDHGTFIINGAERVIVSQLVRSPGAYFVWSTDPNGNRLYSSQVIPNRGAWLEFETDSNGVLYARIDRTRKIPATVLLRALRFGNNQQLLALFGEDPRLKLTLEKDSTDSAEAGLIEIYKKLRPGEPPTLESATSLLRVLFFDPRRYDLALVGRYKLNKKLALRRRALGRILANTVAISEDVYNKEGKLIASAGEVLATEGTLLTREILDRMEMMGINELFIQSADGERKIKIIGNGYKRTAWQDTIRLAQASQNFFGPGGKTLIKAGELIDDEAIQRVEKALPKQRKREIRILKDGIESVVPLGVTYSPRDEKHLTEEDILATVSYQLNIMEGLSKRDDIDHLGNRRLRSVGELLQNQFRIGLARMERVIRERMTIQ